MVRSAPVVAIIALFLLIASLGVDADKKQSKKYSKEANDPHFQQVKQEKYDPDFRTIQRPFRMAKLNLVWAKAQNVSVESHIPKVPVNNPLLQRLTEPKLKSLYMELKIHDKEEIAWKQLNSQHKDKDGLKDDELRRKLIGIMSSYDLLEHFDETQDAEKLKPYKVWKSPLLRRNRSFIPCLLCRNSTTLMSVTKTRAFSRTKNSYGCGKRQSFPASLQRN